VQPPEFPHQPLTDLLDYLSQEYPQLFYKPLFACAASTKEVAIGNHLAILIALSRFLPDFWTRDAEMLSVALMSDAGGGRNLKGNADAGEQGVPWSQLRLGQSVLLMELVGRMRSARTALNRDAVSSVGLELWGAVGVDVNIPLLLGSRSIVSSHVEIRYSIRDAIGNSPRRASEFCVLYLQLAKFRDLDLGKEEASPSISENSLYIFVPRSPPTYAVLETVCLLLQTHESVLK
jgi:hypothetical protein